MGPRGRMGPVNFMGHMGLMGHMRQFLSAVATTPSTADCRLPTAHCPLPTAISACKASSTSPGCNPGSAPPTKVYALSGQFSDAAPAAPLQRLCGRGMGFETQRHRGTQRSGGSANKSCEGASKSVGIHIGMRGLRQITRPAKPAAAHPVHTEHAAFC
jgi:hypothetical protein